jgi:RNA 3'-phosphate cyclase
VKANAATPKGVHFMLEIDGSQKSGSGTILRLSIALASILQRPLHIYNIRQKRPQPGLRPQHLEAVLTAGRICNAEIKGAEIGSKELWYYPSEISGGNIQAEIGTAGSIPMLLMTVLPMCIFAKHSIHLHVVKGGTDVSHSPTINYMKHVFLPVLQKMGITASLVIHRYGYYPKGMGEVTLEVKPTVKLEPLMLENFGEIEEIRGISVCTFLEDRKVAERQAKAANEYLSDYGFTAQMDVVNDRSNPVQKGSSLVLWAKTSEKAVLGADAIGELRKRSEEVGREAAEKLWKEIVMRPTVDVHLADMLIPYVALADEESVFLTRRLTDHLETNIWLAEKILKVKFKVKRVNNLYQIEKLA